MGETNNASSLPALSDLVKEWLNIHFPTEVNFRGPDDWFTEIYYIDCATHGVWIADIDNKHAVVILRCRYNERGDIIKAACPDFFTKLESHIKVRLEEIKEHGRDIHL